jgi:hypothetical protein
MSVEFNQTTRRYISPSPSIQGPQIQHIRLSPTYDDGGEILAGR